MSYLSERKINVITEGGIEELLMTCGVPQGSVGQTCEISCTKYSTCNCPKILFGGLRE